MTEQLEQPGASAPSGYRSSHLSSDAVSIYQRVYAEGTYDTWLSRHEERVLGDLLDRHLGGRAERYLDFACGTGRIIRALESHAGESVGVDISPAMLEVAAGRVERSRLVNGDITRDPSLVDPPYDLITTFRFLVNAEPELRGEALAALAGALAPSGVLVCNVHANRWSLRLPFALVRRHVLRREVGELGIDEAVAFLARAGLEVVELRAVTYLNQSLYRVLGPRLCDRLDRLARRLRVPDRFGVDVVLVCRRAGAPH